jgi:hypothetical protein
MLPRIESPRRERRETLLPTPDDIALGGSAAPSKTKKVRLTRFLARAYQSPSHMTEKKMKTKMGWISLPPLQKRERKARGEDILLKKRLV